MAARRGTLARAAWIVLAVLFAARAVAGSALCELYGEHPVPPSITVSSEAHPHEVDPAAQRHHSADEHPADNRTDHACDEPVYLIGASASAPNLKPWSVYDEVVWAQVALAALPAAVAPRAVNCRHRAHPPPSISPLDLSHRLRI